MTTLAVSSSSCARRSSISVLDAGARLGQGQPADAGIEVVRGFAQRGERQAFGAAVTMRFSTSPSSPTSTASARPSTETDELDLLQPLALLVDQHDAGAARQARQHLARLAEQLLDRAAPPAAGDAALDLAAFLDG